MKSYIPSHTIQGRASRQAHTGLPEGTYEREISKEGFFGPAAHLYHAHPPTGWIDFDGPLKPRAFDLNRLAGTQASPWDATEVLSNPHCRLRLWNAPAKMDHLARNGDGDELIFVHRGRGDLFCDFGHLAYRAGDYIVLPRGTLWRLDCAQASTFLLVEASNASYRLPDRGLVGPHAVFDPAMLDRPELNQTYRDQQADDEIWRVQVKRRGAVTTITYPFNPLDTVGWKGDLSPVRLNVADIRPLMSHRYHLPPSAHSTFLADRFVVCTFVPRPFETAEDALKVPFFHSNDDYDEVIFYHAGDFFSRDKIGPGMMTFHPSGFTHGPHPKALAKAWTQSKPATDEYAVMIDTRDGLDVGDLPAGVEDPDYVHSWRT